MRCIMVGGKDASYRYRESGSACEKSGTIGSGSQVEKCSLLVRKTSDAASKTVPV
jgi:hypothetical protein